MIVRKELINVLSLDQMVKGEFEDAEIVVIDVGATAGDVNFWAREETLGSGNYGDPDIGIKRDPKTIVLCYPEEILFGQVHGVRRLLTIRRHPRTVTILLHRHL